jgi:hypothetical protein
LQQRVGGTAAVTSEPLKRNAIERRVVQAPVEQRRPSAIARATAESHSAGAIANSRRRVLLWPVHSAGAKTNEASRRVNPATTEPTTESTELLCARVGARVGSTEGAVAERRRERYIDVRQKRPEALLPIVVEQLAVSAYSASYPAIQPTAVHAAGSEASAEYTVRLAACGIIGVEESGKT